MSHHFPEHIFPYAGNNELCLKGLTFQRIYFLAKLRFLFFDYFSNENCLISKTSLEDILEFIKFLFIKLLGPTLCPEFLRQYRMITRQIE